MTGLPRSPSRPKLSSPAVLVVSWFAGLPVGGNDRRSFSNRLTINAATHPALVQRLSSSI